MVLENSRKKRSVLGFQYDSQYLDVSNISFPEELVVITNTHEESRKHQRVTEW